MITVSYHRPVGRRWTGNFSSKPTNPAKSGSGSFSASVSVKDALDSMRETVVMP